MKLPVIKSLAETCNLEMLREAEQALLNEEKPSFEIGGDDEGEQLTHVLAAIQILELVQQGTELRQAIRQYTERVRKSIS
jgi:hypothetical protein